MEFYLAGSVIVFVAGVMQGCIGFAFAMLVVPSMMMFLPATQVVPLLVLMSFLNTSTMAYAERRNIQREIVALLIAGAIVGVPIGATVLQRFAGPEFRIGVGVFMIFLSALLFSGWRRPVRRERSACVPVGLLGGFLAGSIGISGPPVVLFLSNQSVPKDVFRATLAGFFTLLGIVSMITFGLKGMLTGEVFRYAIVFAPLVILGTLTGVRASRYIPQRPFERLALSCAALMGLLLIVQNLRTFL